MAQGRHVRCMAYREPPRLPPGAATTTLQSPVGVADARTPVSPQRPPGPPRVMMRRPKDASKKLNPAMLITVNSFTSVEVERPRENTANPELKKEPP